MQMNSIFIELHLWENISSVKQISCKIYRTSGFLNIFLNTIEMNDEAAIYVDMWLHINRFS